MNRPILTRGERRIWQSAVFAELISNRFLRSQIGVRAGPKLYERVAAFHGISINLVTFLKIESRVALSIFTQIKTLSSHVKDRSQVKKVGLVLFLWFILYFGHLSEIPKMTRIIEMDALIYLRSAPQINVRRKFF